MVIGGLSIHGRLRLSRAPAKRAIAAP